MSSSQTHTIAELLERAELILKKSGISAYQTEALLLLSYCLGKSRTALYIHGGDTVDLPAVTKCNQMLARRATREPLAYICGEREFWSMPFWVTPDVLIPRPETEYLLTIALAQRNRDLWSGSILDLCCGSGVIGIVLARELKRSVVATDISPTALSVAVSNSRRHNVFDLLRFICADLLSCFVVQPQFQLIVSNPPYVKAGEINEQLAPEVACFEPHLALNGGPDGLDCIAQMLESVGELLVSGGDCFIEIGSDQRSDIVAIMGQEYCRKTYKFFKIYKDYAQHDRVVQVRKR